MPSKRSAGSWLVIGYLLAACGGDDGKSSSPGTNNSPDASVNVRTGRGDAGTATGANDAGGSSNNAGSDGDAGADNFGSSGPTADSDPSYKVTDYAAWMNSLAKGRSCNIIGSGTYTYWPGIDTSCESACLAAASCSDLMAVICSSGDATNAYADCSNQCDDQYASCGDGTKIDSFRVCDKMTDCANGEDEKHCTPFQCKSGEPVDPTAVCDGVNNCTDGSDEAGCATICGQSVAQYYGDNGGTVVSSGDAGL